MRQCAGVVVRRLINARDAAALKRSSLSVLHVLPIDGFYNVHAFDVRKLGLADLVRAWPALNWSLFWHVIGQERKKKLKKGELVVDAWMALAVSTFVHFEDDDFDDAVQAIAERSLDDDKEVALTLAHRIYVHSGSQPERLATLKAAVAAHKHLKARLAGLLNPRIQASTNGRPQDRAVIKPRFPGCRIDRCAINELQRWAIAAWTRRLRRSS